MWSCDAALRGGQHIPQVPHHHQVLPENVEQCQRDTHLYLSGRSDGGGPAQLELDLRARHGHSVSGGARHRLDFLTASSHRGSRGSCASLTDKLLSRTVIRFLSLFQLYVSIAKSLIFFLSVFFDKSLPKAVAVRQILFWRAHRRLICEAADNHFLQGIYFGTLK